MWIEFKNYQEKAIVKLRQEVNDLLDSEENKICIFILQPAQDIKYSIFPLNKSP